MASTSAATPDTPITLKVNYDGITRRFKLPLRELGASTLEDKVSCFFLSRQAALKALADSRSAPA
jgi:next to BRCA1 gene 1 protein